MHYLIEVNIALMWFHMQTCPFIHPMRFSYGHADPSGKRGNATRCKAHKVFAARTALPSFIQRHSPSQSCPTW
jgi:hypothetical protein